MCKVKPKIKYLNATEIINNNKFGGKKIDND